VKKDTVSTILHGILVLGVIVMMMPDVGAMGDLIALIGILGVAIFYLVDEFRNLGSTPKIFKAVLILIPALISVGALVGFGSIFLFLPLLFLYSFIKTKFSQA
jgi:hypothetical protein